MFLRIISTALALSGVAFPAVAAPTSLSCSATGTKLLSPPAPPSAVCARMKAGLEKAMARKLADAPAETAAVSIDIRFARPSSAIATIIERRSGRIIRHPVMSVDVMDRAIGLKSIDMLAAEVAKQLRAR
jgi:hypothetical protein